MFPDAEVAGPVPVDACQKIRGISGRRVPDGEQVIVIDGCHDCCATKKLAGTSIAPHVHIIATDLGIEKNGMADVQYQEIERVVAAVQGALSGE